jgi:pimeloyl-ACP methyl ester carboxylesterase
MQDERNRPVTGIGSRTIVCVHGAGAGGWEWGIWARVLTARGFDVIAPDLMPRADGLGVTRFADYRDQVVAWCRAAPDTPILLGASLGGLLALAAASEIDAAALILVNPLMLRDGADLVAPAWPALVPWARGRSLAGTRRAMPDADDAARMYAFRRWRDESGAVLNDARDWDMPSVPIACPILVLASEGDADVPPASSHRLAGRLGADCETIVQASHVGPLLGRSAALTAERACDWLLARIDLTAT